MKVKDAMHQGATWMEASTPLQQVAKVMQQEDIGSVPIGENDRLLGMVTDRDIACRSMTIGRDMKSLTARDVMTKPIVYCYADEELEDAVRLMQRHAIRRLPVIDGNKRLVGMLSLGDVSAAGSRDLTGEVTKAVSAHH